MAGLFKVKERYHSLPEDRCADSYDASKDPLAPTFLPKILPQLLEHNILRPNRIRLFKESDGPILKRVNTVLGLLRENKISGEKAVVELKWN